MSLVEMAAILLAGVGAGTINAVVGSGTLITFPTLLAFGYPPVIANVSNTVGLVPGGLSGRLQHRRLGARGAVGGDRLSARARRPTPTRAEAGPRLPARRRRRGRPAAGAPRGRVLGDRPGAGRPGLRAGRPPADHLRLGRQAPRRQRARRRRLVGLAGGAADRCLRRLLRCRPGGAADGRDGHRHR
ncbi:hypothetical protein NOCA2430037 [metagenome]|uniref:Uncharacterized protein n=1 Tax=metagenome TaxID=256318 RepID=A0A2P2C6T1_9ZZZZ